MPLCDYGCGQEAKHQFKNGKWCCSSNLSKCPNIKKKNSQGNKGKFPKGNHPNSGKPAWNKGIPRTEEEKEKIRLTTIKTMSNPEIRDKIKQKLKNVNLKDENHHNWKGGYDKRGIPTFDKFSKHLQGVEIIRRNKEDFNILEVKCAYCGKWFIPSLSSVYERVRALKNIGGESRLYCSKKCKKECPSFYKSLYPKGFKPATSREVQPELRQMRFEVDNYTCQRCKKHQDQLVVGLHCHHIEGIRWEPLESADIDKVITLCKDCHIEVHKQEGCGYNDMQCK